VCKFNPKNDSRRIDPCMENFIANLNMLMPDFKTVACCCGHGKYPMTIVVRNRRRSDVFDLVSSADIPRKKQFYKKDKQGMYFIPETLEKKK